MLLLRRRESGVGQTAGRPLLEHGQRVPVPESSLFADSARDAAALNAALHQLAIDSDQRL